MNSITIGIFLLASYLWLPVLACSSDSNNPVTLTTTSGTLLSPGYPQFHEGATQCYCLISVPKGNVVALAFDAFAVGRRGECIKEIVSASYVEVRDGRENRSTILGRFCGSSKPGKIVSSGNEMLIAYRTNGYRSTRFKARYNAVPRPSITQVVVLALLTVCGTVLCVCITIAVVKRRENTSDDDSPTRDQNVKGICSTQDQPPLHACALDQLPCILLGGCFIERPLECTDLRNETRRDNGLNDDKIDQDSVVMYSAEMNLNAESIEISSMNDVISQRRELVCNMSCRYSAGITRGAHCNLAINDNENEFVYSLHSAPSPSRKQKSLRSFCHSQDLSKTRDLRADVSENNISNYKGEDDILHGVRSAVEPTHPPTSVQITK